MTAPPATFFRWRSVPERQTTPPCASSAVCWPEPPCGRPVPPTTSLRRPSTEPSAAGGRPCESSSTASSVPSRSARTSPCCTRTPTSMCSLATPPCRSTSPGPDPIRQLSRASSPGRSRCPGAESDAQLLVIPAMSVVQEAVTSRAAVGGSALVATTKAPSVMAPRMMSARSSGRSEEHTSELQSLMRNSYAVFCLKKKKNIQNQEKNTKKKNKNNERDNRTIKYRQHNQAK